MQSRRAATIAAASSALLVVGLAACSSSSPSTASSASAASAAGTDAVIPQLTVGDDDAIPTLNPDKTADTVGAYGALESLVKFGPTGQIEPSLAASVTQPNPATYVYHLRPGVTFWDGDPMTSADVVNALDYEREPSSEIASHFTGVKSITADGPETVIVTLDQANAIWESQVAVFGMIFEQKFQQAHPTTMGQPGVLIEGTGPLEIDSFDPTTGLKLSANPHWWGGPVRVKHVTVQLFANETDEALAFRAGEIDVAHDVLNPKAFASTSGANLVSTPAFSEGYFGMNYQQAPWNNIHVRRAVAYALNRADIIAALGNKAEPVTTLIPPDQLTQVGSQSQVSAMINALPSYPFNLAKAKAELAQSPYPHGFTASAITINFGAYTPINEAIAGDLAKIGINLKLDLVSFNQYIEDLTGPRNLGGTYLTFNVISPDPSSFPSSLLGTANLATGGWNYANYAPTAMNTLLTEGTTTLQPAKRLSIYNQMLTMLGTDEPYVPLFIQDYNIALSSSYTLPGYTVWDELGAWVLDIRQAK
jgi:peptide/nickel transport system substrate-binding protein